jgi:surfactin synthase thioesterase subunit
MATVDALAVYLAQLKRKERHFVSRSIEMPREQLAKLSPERRRLLELKLRARGTPKTDTSQFRLFCFPHAGGGTAFFRNFRNVVELAPVQYPGHESRRSEKYAASMDELVDSLLHDLRPALAGDFAFFGHSMGAIVAFELVRALRRNGLPLPRLLIASGARAPQFRRNHKPGPDPTREELLEQVRRLEGLPDPEMAELILPSLEADTALYRRYVYQEEPPLDVPVTAVGGDSDPNVGEHHIRAWSEQTTAPFTWQLLPGGHFFLRANEPAFLAWLRRVLG